MAVPRGLGSSATFVFAAAGSLLGRGGGEEPDPLGRLSRAMQHGTAKHVVVEAGEDQPGLSIVAQAESKTALQKRNRKCFSLKSRGLVY